MCLRGEREGRKPSACMSRGAAHGLPFPQGQHGQNYIVSSPGARVASIFPPLCGGRNKHKTVRHEHTSFHTVNKMKLDRSLWFRNVAPMVLRVAPPAATSQPWHQWRPSSTASSSSGPMGPQLCSVSSAPPVSLLPGSG